MSEYKKRQREISSEMQAHVDADEICLTTAKIVLDLAKRAKDLFLSSSVEEKQQLLKLVHSNFLLDSGKLHWEMSEPFSTFIKMKDCMEWCARLATLRTYNWKRMKTTLSVLPEQFRVNPSSISIQVTL